MKERAARVALALAALGLLGLVLEGALRVLPARVRGYDVVAGTFVQPLEFEPDLTTNRRGFHDVEHPPGPVSRERVLLLGDSYVEAISVPLEDTVGRRLAAELEARAPGRFEVISVGRRGWGQERQLVALRRLGPLYRPSLVLTLFLSLNDVRDDSPELSRLHRANDRGIDRRRPGWLRLPLAQAPFLWWPGSELNRFVSLRLARLGARQEAASDVPFDYQVYRVPEGPAWERAWRAKREVLGRTRDAARALGARYALASASTPQGILGPERGLAVLQAAYPAMRAGTWDLAAPDRRLAALCAEAGIPFLALEPLLRARHRDDAPLHWPYDGHWNARGNRLAAELLAGFVLQQAGEPG
jgi:hypothetical protein